MKLKAYTPIGLWKSKELTEEQAEDALIELYSVTSVDCLFIHSNGRQRKVSHPKRQDNRSTFGACCDGTVRMGISIKCSLCRSGYNMHGERLNASIGLS